MYWKGLLIVPPRVHTHIILILPQEKDNKMNLINMFEKRFEFRMQEPSCSYKQKYNSLI